MTSAQDVIADLQAQANVSQIEAVARFFKGSDPDTRIMGVPMPKVFPVAKAHRDLDLAEIETLLDNDHYEVRMAAVSILDFKARQKRLNEAEREAIFELYLKRHDRINNWDLVDRAAPFVVGHYLIDKERSVLDELSKSDDPHERRTALVATYAFIKRGEVDDTFRIAETLANDLDPYVQKAIGSWTREAGKKDRAALVRFLTRVKDRLPRPTMTAASKFLPDRIRAELRA